MPGQTLKEIRGLLAAAGLSPRHRFGQNFLIDLNLMRKLVEAAEVKAADVVLEVGAGTGSLSELLLDQGARVIGVEIDRGLQTILRSRVGESANFTLIAGDALAGKHEINPAILEALQAVEPSSGGARKLVANLPYQIATPFLLELLYASPALERMTCTLQKEVAERLDADPQTSAYGPVSVVVQSLAEVEIVAVLPPEVFWPRPQVESVMLTIRPLPPERVEVEDIAGFVRLVRRSFQNRRKMLRSSARAWNLPEIDAAFARAGINPDDRPEDLPPSAWRRLSAALSHR